MRYLIVYLILESLYEYVNPYEDYILSGLNIWGFVTILLLIVCFVIAKKSLGKRHQLVFIEIFSNTNQPENQNLEEALSRVASKRLSTKLIIDEIFMDQILKLIIAAALTYGANHLLS
jgi:hypothetical protein